MPRQRCGVSNLKPLTLSAATVMRCVLYAGAVVGGAWGTIFATLPLATSVGAIKRDA